MREIKFRGYLKDEKIWKYGYYYKGTINSGTPLCLGDCLIRHCIITDDGTMWHMPNAKTVCMFTGRLDENGIEIYQGDKLENTNDETDLIVEWCDETLSWSIARRCPDTGNLYSRHSFNDFKNLYVVGNIHENPELLGDTNEKM